MPPRARELGFIFHTYFPEDFGLSRSLYILASLIGLYPLWRLHVRQRQDPGQRATTAWLKRLQEMLASAARQPQEDDVEADEGPGEDSVEDMASSLVRDADFLYDMLRVNPATPSPTILSPQPPLILCTPYTECILCDPNALRSSLRFRSDTGGPQVVQVLMGNISWQSA